MKVGVEQVDKFDSYAASAYGFEMRFLILSAALLLCSPFAYACRGTQFLTKEDVAQAQSVFIGRLVDYKPWISSKASVPAQITYEVIEVLSGKPLEGLVTVNWSLGSFGTPENLDEWRGLEMKVGILYPETFPERCEMVETINGHGETRGVSEHCMSRFSGSGKSDNPWVLSLPCGQTYIYDSIDPFDGLASNKR